jgi:hypothetical protein
VVPVLFPRLTIAISSIISKDFGYNKKIITLITTIRSKLGLLAYGSLSYPGSGGLGDNPPREKGRSITQREAKER